MKQVQLTLSKTDLNNLRTAVLLRLEASEDGSWFSEAKRWRRMLDILKRAQIELDRDENAKKRQKNAERF